MTADHEPVRTDSGDDTFVTGLGAAGAYSESRADGGERAAGLHHLHGLGISFFHVMQAAPHPDVRN